MIALACRNASLQLSTSILTRFQGPGFNRVSLESPTRWTAIIDEALHVQVSKFCLLPYGVAYGGNGKLSLMSDAKLHEASLERMHLRAYCTIAEA